MDRLRVALDETRVEPPKKADGTRVGSLRTNLEFLQRLVRNETAIGGDTTTDLIARNPDLTKPLAAEPTEEAALAAALFQVLNEMGGSSAKETAQAAPSSNWSQISRREGVRL